MRGRVTATDKFPQPVKLSERNVRWRCDGRDEGMELATKSMRQKAAVLEKTCAPNGIEMEM